MEVAAHSVNMLMSSVTAVFIVLDSKGCVLQWNEAAEQVFDLSAIEAIGANWRKLNVRWQAERIERLLHLTERNPAKTWQEEVRITGEEGRQYTYVFVSSPLRHNLPVARLGSLLLKQGHIGPDAVARGLEKQLLGDQRPLGVILAEEAGLDPKALEHALQDQEAQAQQESGYILLGVDMTERRALDSQLAHLQKLESIGQLAAGIAHEINTPTQFIGDNLRFLEESCTQIGDLLEKYGALVRRLEAVPEYAEICAEIRAQEAAMDLEYVTGEVPMAISQSLEGNERVASIVRAMKEFSHPGGEGITAMDINHALESTLTVARNEYKYVAEVVLELEPHLPMVPCLPGELNQVFLNLLVNAAHAIEEKACKERGTITVRTRRLDGFVEIDIEDTGMGIPEKIRSRIFDPFFTTKEVGKGTGQGLAIAHSVVVDKHHGNIRVDSTLGQGTIFTIRLPLTQVDAAGEAISA